jgi:hypothetical protein
MNYSVLFPKVLNNLPEFNKDDFQLNPIQESKKINVYVPYGKKHLLWFTKINNNKFCFLIELQQNKPKHVKFKYASFKDELTLGKGTLIYGTVVNDSFCCEKIIYNNGIKDKNKSFMVNLENMKLLIEYYIKNEDIEYFLKINLPYINNSLNPITDASNLAYRVYQIKQNNNYYINISNISCVFRIEPLEVIKDVYELYYYDKGEYKKYDNALVNDFKTSCLLNRFFNKKLKHYKNIEYSDDEEEDINYLSKEYGIINCIYIPQSKKWKPYYFMNHSTISNYKDIKNIENKYNKKHIF